MARLDRHVFLTMFAVHERQRHRKGQGRRRFIGDHAIACMKRKMGVAS
jgi:hypothetical protein